MTSLLVQSLNALRSCACNSSRRAQLFKTIEVFKMISDEVIFSRAFARYPEWRKETLGALRSSVDRPDEQLRVEKVADAVEDEIEEPLQHEPELEKPTYRFLKTEPIFPVASDESRDSTQTMIDAGSFWFKGGDGGHGVVRFTSLFAKQFAGPDGGDGGNGGHLVLRAKEGLNTLGHIDHLTRAAGGVKGDRFSMHGQCAEHTFIEVPLGTMVRHHDTNELLADLTRDGQIYVAARGGGGGKGNASFLTNENRAPDYAEEGAPGEERHLYLEMRTIADVGLIGFPNAGKSTFLRGITRARPKTAPYPFTTLTPHVGIVHFTDETTLSIADIPGIVPGAHKGHGLGLDFLRHVQRCKCLLYVIDLSVENVVDQLVSLRFELEEFQTGLSQRPQAILGNKIDEKNAKINLIKLKTFLEEEGSETTLLPVSGRDLVNMRELLIALKLMVDGLS